jgi:hypothetical protein
MKFQLTMYINPAIWDAASEEVRNAVMEGHGEFIAKTKASGEFISTYALGDPSQAKVVRVADGGGPSVTDGLFLQADVFQGGYYLVEVEDEARAFELAALIPDAGIEGLGIEVRPVIFSDTAV